MAKRTFLILVLSIAASMTLALNEDADFVGYMENLEKVEKERQRINKMLQEHEEWRQNTWGGFVVRQVQAIGKHFAPFFLAVSDAMSENRSGPTQLILLVVIRIMIISICVAAVYAIGQIINMIMGNVIIVEETVLVDDDKQIKSEKRRGAREKKKES